MQSFFKNPHSDKFKYEELKEKNILRFLAMKMELGKSPGCIGLIEQVRLGKKTSWKVGLHPGINPCPKSIYENGKQRNFKNSRKNFQRSIAEKFAL